MSEANICIERAIRVTDSCPHGMPCESKSTYPFQVDPANQHVMTIIEIDPDALCDRATRNLQQCLIDEGQRLFRSHELQQALDTLFHAYSLRPGASPILHSIATVYTALDDPESATACRRGVIPEAAEKRYFNAEKKNNRLIPARKASHSQHLQTHRPESISLTPPASNDRPELRPEFRAKSTESMGSFVTVMDNAGVWFDGFNTVVMDSKQRILREHIKGNAYAVADIAKSRSERALRGTVCFLDARSSNIYYHWMIDILPKFALLKTAGISLDSIDYFIVRCKSDFQKRTLEQLGVPMERVTVPWTEGVNRCSRLIIPFLKHDRGERYYNGLGLGMAQWVPQWLKTTFINSDVTFGSKLYISRVVRGTRQPTDEALLIRELTKRGFRCVSMESMTVPEQATLMAGANIVISPHGAGLTNIAFCRPGTTVVEIFGEYVVPCYWALSELAQLNYHAYFVQTNITDNEQGKNNGQHPKSLSERRQQNISLDVVDFVTYVDHLDTQQAIAS